MAPDEKMFEVLTLVLLDLLSPDLSFFENSVDSDQLASNEAHTVLFVCLFVWFDSLRLINNLSVIKGWVFLGWTSTKLGLMCLAQGHNAVTSVRLEPVAPRSRVKHSTTKPLGSHTLF